MAIDPYFIPRGVQNTKQKPGIPNPEQDLQSHQAALMAIKEALEVLLAQRGHPADHAVTWADLKEQGLVTDEQIEARAKRVGANRFGRHP